MERPSEGWTLMDGYLAEVGGPRTTALLKEIDQFVPWDQLARPIEATYQNNTRKGGRPHWPVPMMLRCLILAKLYNLSDPALEECLQDRISFRRFVGLGMADDTPDETSIVRFRKRLLDHGLASDLFDTLKDCLQQRDLILKEGTIVDATIIQAPRGRDRHGKPSPTADPAATQTVKHHRPYFGYKAHVATDLNGMITNYIFDTAKVADVVHIDQLIADETQAVFADSAYMDKQRQARLEAAGIFCGIIQRRVRGQSALRPEQRAHNRLCAKFRAAVEHPFASLKNTGGFHRTRYRGIARNALDFCLGAMMVNIRRGLSLLRERQQEACLIQSIATA